MGLIDIENLPKIEPGNGVEMRAVTAQTITVAHVKLEEGALVPEHWHYHEQVVNVVEGELELVVDGESFRLVPGKVMVLPPNVSHSGRAVTACRVVDVFHPVRQDLAEAGK